MPEPFAEKIIQKIEEARSLYHKLVILLASAGSGKTAALRRVHQRTSAPLININIELSRRMLDLTERQRALQLSRLLNEIIDAASSDTILMDNIEILFDISLKQDPLRLLQGLSRNKTIVAAWSGNVSNGHLLYASPDHAEYKRYPIKDFLVVSPNAQVDDSE